jgi:rhodanese/phosphatase family protein
MSHPPFNWNWIEEGKIAAGSIPFMLSHVTELRRAGIRSILTLTQRDPQTYPNMDDIFADLEWLHLPLVDCAVPDESKISFGMGWLVGARSAGNWPVYVHCRGGIGRTGLMLIAFYVLVEGKSLDEARELLRTKRVCPHTGNTGDSHGSPQLEWKLAIPTFWER